MTRTAAKSRKPAKKPAPRKAVAKPAPKATAPTTIAFEVFNRWTGALQFTAQIACAVGEWPSIKLGLAVKWAFKNGASLDGASLVGASLVGARLVGASLDGASLVGASLVGARLDGASLDGARLDGASLVGASLVGARLDGASLVGARLDGASLDGASLVGASLDGGFKLAAGESIFMLGCPNGWYAYTFFTDKGEQRVRVGCRNKTLAEGRAYWANKPDRREVMAALDYAEAIGKARGWVAEPVKQAAE